MLRFDKEQLVIDVAGMKMGGQPGEYPNKLSVLLQKLWLNT